MMHFDMDPFTILFLFVIYTTISEYHRYRQLFNRKQHYLLRKQQPKQPLDSKNSESAHQDPFGVSDDYTDDVVLQNIVQASTDLSDIHIEKLPQLPQCQPDLKSIVFTTKRRNESNLSHRTPAPATTPTHQPSPQQQNQTPPLTLTQQPSPQQQEQTPPSTLTQQTTNLPSTLTQQPSPTTTNLPSTTSPPQLTPSATQSTQHIASATKKSSKLSKSTTKTDQSPTDDNDHQSTIASPETINTDTTSDESSLTTKNPTKTIAKVTLSSTTQNPSKKSDTELADSLAAFALKYQREKIHHDENGKTICDYIYNNDVGGLKALCDAHRFVLFQHHPSSDNDREVLPITIACENGASVEVVSTLLQLTTQQLQQRPQMLSSVYRDKNEITGLFHLVVAHKHHHSYMRQLTVYDGHYAVES
jgi:hypothetical protein